MATDRAISIEPGARELFCLRMSVPTLAALRDSGYRIAVGNFPDDRTAERWVAFSAADIILVDVTACGKESAEAIRKLRSALCLVGSASRILCFSTTRRNPRFAIELGKCGARYARVDGIGMLIEAIEILGAEMSELERHGPCFLVVHRFSNGTCVPGEEIGGIELLRGGERYQLRLALSQRFVFNLLAENRALALDAFQIAAGLSSHFYREHGRNAGIRQTVKVRVATVKVIVARIRKAMAGAFKEAGVVCDPYEVLRTVTAEGSSRALYRLHADIRLEHRLR